MEEPGRGEKAEKPDQTGVKLRPEEAKNTRSMKRKDGIGIPKILFVRFFREVLRCSDALLRYLPNFLSKLRRNVRTYWKKNRNDFRFQC